MKVFSVWPEESEETEGSQEVKAVFLDEMNNIMITAFCDESKYT